MNIEKYLKNKEEDITNDNIDFDKLQKDLTKGYVKESDIEKPDYSGYVAKSDFDKLQSDYTSLESNYNATIKTLDDTNAKVSKVSLENSMLKTGFKAKDFDEVSKMRTSMYSEEKDDIKALNQIKEKYSNTFFPKTDAEKFTPAPNESGAKGGDGNSTPKEPIQVTRKSSMRDFISFGTKK